MTNSSVLWTSSVEQLSDGHWRRRALIPAAGLKALRWSMASRDALEWGVGAIAVAVIDAADPRASSVGEKAVAAGAGLVFDVARWVEANPAPTQGQWAALVELIRPAAAVAAPDRATAAQLEAAGVGPVWVVDDAVETPTALQLAAIAAKAPFKPEPLPARETRLAVWFAQPGDGDAAEIAAVAAAQPGLAAAGWRLLAVAPADVLSGLTALAPAIQTTPWTLEGQFSQLARAEAALLPGKESASRRRRAATAERLGLAIALGGALPGSATVAVPDLAPSAAMDAAQAWSPLLDAAFARRGVLRPPARPLRLMIFLDLIQDTDLCLPLVAAASLRTDVQVRVVMTRWLAEQTPSTLTSLKALGIKPQIVERDHVSLGKAPKLEGVDAVLTPVATNLNAHRRGDAVVQRAKLVGVPTFSLQHGLENVGLSYADERHNEAVEITSDHLFVWFPPDFYPAASPALRRKFVSVGTVKSTPRERATLPLAFGEATVVAVFENLHWHRYSDGFRKRFMEDLRRAAARFPDRLFLLKPHHAGRWASKGAASAEPENLMVINPQDPAWEPFTAPAIIDYASVVITTPSTVALDAAIAGKPVAVVGYDLDLPLYRPLPVLRSTRNWMDMMTDYEDGADALRAAFLRRTLLAQDASQKLLDALIALTGRLI